MKDRFGVSWQIVSRQLIRLIGDADHARARRAFETMMKMKRIDIAAIERAAHGHCLIRLSRHMQGGNPAHFVTAEMEPARRPSHTLRGLLSDPSRAAIRGAIAALAREFHKSRQ